MKQVKTHIISQTAEGDCGDYAFINLDKWCTHFKVEFRARARSAWGLPLSCNDYLPATEGSIISKDIIAESIDESAVVCLGAVLFYGRQKQIQCKQKSEAAATRQQWGRKKKPV